MDPTELRELKARALGEGTPPHGTKPTSKLSASEIRALITAPTAEKQTTEPLSIIDLARFMVSERIPVVVEDNSVTERVPVLTEAAFDLTRVCIELRPTLPTTEMTPLDHEGVAAIGGALRSETRVPLRTEELSAADLVRLVVPEQPKRLKFTAIETAELLDMLATDQMTPLQVERAQEPPRAVEAAGEIDVRAAAAVVSLPTPTRRSADPTWQVPRAGKMSARSIIRLLFGRRR